MYPKTTGKILKGYAGRGCYLSSEALQQQELKRHVMSNRIKQFTQQGDNSYFLDVDATDLLFDDFSAAHPMTIYQDRANRIARMRYISQTKQLVLGSETALPWASPVIAYTNGSFACFTEVFWPLLSDKKQFGNWWPPERPTIFFKSYSPSAEFIKASYEPRYRLPLYQAVLHDAIVSTDRWEVHSLKIPALFQTKMLLESLYNVPAIWALDQKALQQNAQKFKTYYQFFSPLHQASGLLPLTEFTWLTPNRLVQQTQFGNRIKIIANFSDKSYQGLASQCVKSIWIKTGQINTFCP